LSLPLPRSVGVEADDDLLCLRVNRSTEALVSAKAQAGAGQEHNGVSELCDSIKTELSQQLPEGLELLKVRVAEVDTSPRPSVATYVLVVREEYLDEKLIRQTYGGLKARIGHLLASDTLNIQRRTAAGQSTIDDRQSKIKNVDVRGFLKSIMLEDRCIVVECKISSAGSIRVEEILNLLELDQAKLAAPIRRTNVQWQEIHPS
jgi:hypothetical protein